MDFRIDATLVDYSFCSLSASILVGLAILSSFLAGYSTAKSKVSHTIYTLSYVAITAFTIYVIIELEFRRIGVIRLEHFEQLLEDEKRVIH